MIDKEKVQDLFEDINTLTASDKEALFIRLIKQNKSDERQLEIANEFLNEYRDHAIKISDELRQKNNALTIENRILSDRLSAMAFDTLKQAEEKMRELNPLSFMNHSISCEETSKRISDAAKDMSGAGLTFNEMIEMANKVGHEYRMSFDSSELKNKNETPKEVFYTLKQAEEKMQFDPIALSKYSKDCEQRRSKETPKETHSIESEGDFHYHLKDVISSLHKLAQSNYSK